MRVYRIIYEWYHGSIPKGYHIHHIDFNHYNNDPSNLEALTPEEHGKKHGWHIPNQTGKKWVFTQKHKDNISKARKGMKFSEEHILNMSKAKKGKPSTRLGYRRENVSKHALYMREYREKNRG